MKAAVNRNQKLRLFDLISSVNALRGVACWLAFNSIGADAVRMPPFLAYHESQARARCRSGL